MRNPSSTPSTSSVRHISTIEAAIDHCAKHCNHPLLSPGFVPTRLLFVGTNQDSTVRVVITNTDTTSNSPTPTDDASIRGNHHNFLDQRGRNESSRNNRKYRYAALSYCWGPPSDAKTQCTITTSTLAARQVGIRKEELSPILIDAIAVTRRLGLSYLWIDSLCILQDDLADWEAESSVMGRIYSNAWVTIVGLGSQSCRVGFVHGRWSEPLNQASLEDTAFEGAAGLDEFVEEGAKHCDQNYEKNEKCHGSDQQHEILAAQIGQGQQNQDDNEDFERIDAPSPSAWEFASAMSKSRWSTRGWTFQEKALSTRLLYFDRTNIHLRCANYTFREGKRGPLLKKQLAFLEPSDDTANTNIVTGKASLEVVEELLESWRNIFIPRFATCEFSRRDDNLPAISGLARYVAEVSGYRYAAGLWVEDLGREVVWYGSGRGRLGSRSNNASSVSTPRFGFVDLINWLSEKEENIAPSWSWAREGGGMGSLDFLDIPTAMMAPDGKETVNVVATFHVSVELKGLNPYGQVTDGELTITSKILPLLPEEYAKDSSGFELDWVVDIDRGLPDGLEMVLVGNYDIDVWMEPGSGLAKQRRVYGLVVCPSPVKLGKFYRVGMFSRPHVRPGWMNFDVAKQRTTFVV